MYFDFLLEAWYSRTEKNVKILWGWSESSKELDTSLAFGELGWWRISVFWPRASHF